MNQLVIAALQEGGINSKHGLKALGGQTRGEGDRVLLGNAHVKVTLGEAFFKLHQARAFAHGRGNTHQTLVLRRHITQPVAKHLRERSFGRDRGLLYADRRVKFAWPVVGNRVGLGHLVALPFTGHHMQKLRAGQVFDVL